MKKKEFKNFLPLKTDRLIIREINLSDVDLLLKMDKQEETQKYLGGIKNKSYYERLHFIKNKLSKKDNISIIVTTLDNKSIGFVDVKILENDICELSYIFDYNYTNNGYCTEACRKVINLLFNKLKIKEIKANTIESNFSSRKVLEKLSFKIIGNIIKDDMLFLEFVKTSCF